MVDQLEVRAGDLDGLLHCLRLHQNSVLVRAVPLHPQERRDHHDWVQKIVVMLRTRDPLADRIAAK